MDCNKSGAVSRDIPDTGVLDYADTRSGVRSWYKVMCKNDMILTKNFTRVVDESTEPAHCNIAIVHAQIHGYLCSKVQATKNR